MIIDRNNVNEIVNLSGTKPEKDYGQNFLIDNLISSKIVESLEPSNNEYILEIGPGLGSLTHYIAGKCKLDVCDIDIRMINFLKGVYKNEINYIYEDVRKIDVSKYDKIIGNLPYNITTELVTFLLLNAKKCRKMVLMCQQEAFSRFFDSCGENYGAITVLIHLLGTSKKILTAKPGAFYPSPKCNSLVFSFEYFENVDLEEMIKVYKMCKSLFLNRRKTILNNLKNYLGDSHKATKILDSLKIAVNKRPEEISPKEYLEMYNLLSK